MLCDCARILLVDLERSDLHINEGGLDLRMSHQLHEGWQADAGTHHIRGEGVSKAVRIGNFDAGSLAMMAKQRAQPRGGHAGATSGALQRNEQSIGRLRRPLQPQIMIEQLSCFHLMNLEQRTTHERLTRICFIDYDREMALVAVRRNPESGESEILGVSRLMKIHGTRDAEVAALVSDQWQGRGLGKELLARLQIVGADEKLARLTADILPDNRDVMRICEKLGFKLEHSLDDEVIHAEFQLS